MKIGVLRANALGDVIVTIPALKALKSTYPESEVVLIGRQGHQELFEGRESPVDRVIPLPSRIQFDRPLIFSPDDEVLNSLKSESFDVLVQLHGGGRYSNTFVNLVSPKKSIGARTPEAEKLDTFCTYNQYQHEVLRQFEILDLIGAKGPLTRPELNATDEDKNRGADFLRSLNINGPVVLINPGAKDPRRRWPPEKFAEVAKELVSSQLNVLINVGPDETHLAQSIRNICPEARMISPSIKDLIAILTQCQLVVSNDTGTMHVSLALNIPTVALFWFKNLIGYGPFDSKFSKVIVAWENRCRVCGHNCSVDPCAHEESLIAEISSEDVLTACRSYLKKEF